MMRTLFLKPEVRLAAALLLAGAGLWVGQPAHANPANKPVKPTHEAPAAAASAAAPSESASATSAAAGSEPLADPMETMRERLKEKMRPRGPAEAAEPAASAASTPTAASAPASAATPAAQEDPETQAMTRLRERLSKRLGLDVQAGSGNELRLTTRAASPAEVEAARQAAHSPSVAAARARSNDTAALQGGRGRAPGLVASASATAVSPGSAYPATLAAAASSSAASAAAAAAPPVPALPWSYAGPNGPQAWGKLKPEFAACGQGKRQSPIDIRDGIPVNLEPLVFAYREASMRVVDDGRSLTAQVGSGNVVQLRGRRYELQSVQLHMPAEERVQGKVYDMSADLLHKDAQGQWLVVSVLLERGPSQALLQTLLDNLPLENGDDVAATQPVDWSGLLPADPRYHIYMGSLSAPPCTEGVVRVVMKTPMTVSPEQYAIFSRLYPMNARPTQAMAGRMVKESN